MKITIDTTEKKIQLHGEVGFTELSEALTKMLGKEAKDYKIINGDEPKVILETVLIGNANQPSTFKEYNHQSTGVLYQPPYKITC